MASGRRYEDEDEDARLHRSSTSKRHHKRSRRHQGPEDTVDAPALDDLRQARADYYSTSPEDRRRTKEMRPMTQETRTRDRNSITVERTSSRRTSERPRRHTSGQDEKRARPRSDEDSAVYVYRTVDVDDGSAGRRSQRETVSPDTPSRRYSTRADNQATKTARRQSVRERTPSPSRRRSKLVVEEIVRDTSNDRRRAAADPVDAGRPSTGTSRTPPRDATRANRSYSMRDPTSYMYTRPSVKRSNTTSQARAPSVAISNARRDNYAPPESARERRGSGIWSFLRPQTAPEQPSRRSVVEVERAPEPEKLYECLVCMADDIPASKSIKLPCGHRQCSHCLKRAFRLALSDPQLMPPTCCNQQEIPYSYVARLFDRAFKHEYEKKRDEFSTKNRIYCPTKGCGKWIKPSDVRNDLLVGGRYGQCSRCSRKVCMKCNMRYHPGKKCGRDETLSALAREKGWQRCYNCKAMVELKEGCNHMTCRCRAEFCMLCAKRWKTCDCPWFNYTDVAPDDRLHDMNVPRDIRIMIDEFAPNRDRNRGQGPRYVDPPPLRRTGHRDLNGRGAQEAADEAYARRLQHRMYADEPLAYGAAPPPPAAPVNVEVYGVGNAGGHHMNETYRVVNEPSARPREATREAPRVSPPIRRSRTLRERVLGRDSPRDSPRHTPRNSEATLSASTLAGMTRSNRTGEGRVDGWRRHISPVNAQGPPLSMELLDGTTMVQGSESLVGIDDSISVR